MTSSQRNSLLVPRTLGLWVCFALSVLVPVSRPSTSSTSGAARVSLPVPPEAITVAPASGPGPTFRLGDAARPFGWSTAVGDFNTDGQPDVAVADHIARRSSNYAYRLEFSVSGQAPHDVTFESTLDAITVRLADVDRDNDLDVIVGAPLSGDTVAIWLNDGHGHFTDGDVRQVPVAVAPLQSVSTTDPSVHVTALDVSPRRAGDALPAVFGAPLAGAGHQSVSPRSLADPSGLLAGPASPRAPPTRRLDALS